MTTDGGLFGSSRPEGPRPKLVVIGIAWAAFGVVALIAAVLMSSVGFAVFGVLCVLAGGGLYAGQRARERLEEDERSWRSDPGGFPDDDEEFEPAPGDRSAPDDGAPHDPDRHATRVMSSGDHDDIVDAEFYEDWEPSPSEQDDGTGYDDEETAYRRHLEHEQEREARAREEEPRVIEADDDTDGEPDEREDETTDERTASTSESTAEHARSGSADEGRDRPDATS